MKNLILLSICCLLSITSYAQSINAETRTVGAFDQIKVNSVIQVEIYHGAAGEIEINTENIPTEKITSTVRNGKLIFDLEKNRRGWNDIEVTVRVPFNKLTRIEGRTASRIYADDTLDIDELTIKLNEASRCELDITCEQLEVDLNSASTLEISGTCQKLDADVNSASNLSAFELIVQDADINANSTAKAKVNVKEDLHISASSMAKVTYMGEPNKLYRDKSSMATIKQVSGKLKAY